MPTCPSPYRCAACCPSGRHRSSLLIAFIALCLAVPAWGADDYREPLATFVDAPAAPSPLRIVGYEQPAFAPLKYEAIPEPTSAPAGRLPETWRVDAPPAGATPVFATDAAPCAECSAWRHHVLPTGLIYRTYLAGLREPRISSVTSQEDSFGTQWDTALGARVALWRYGTAMNNGQADGWELELEGAVFPRLDPVAESTPLIASDYRIGIPLVYGNGPWHYKLAYYHLSSHLGDEWILLYPSITRLNYVRDEIVLGAGVYLADDWRLYAEMGYAPSASDGAEPLEFQFGAEFSPIHHNTWRGAPFAAFNVHLRQENDFGGNLCLQGGWQWRNGEAGQRLRLGMQFVTGKSDQGEFYNVHEQRLGFGVWYDF